MEIHGFMDGFYLQNYEKMNFFWIKPTTCEDVNKQHGLEGVQPVTQTCWGMNHAQQYSNHVC